MTLIPSKGTYDKRNLNATKETIYSLQRTPSFEGRCPVIIINDEVDNRKVRQMVLGRDMEIVVLLEWNFKAQ